MSNNTDLGGGYLFVFLRKRLTLALTNMLPSTNFKVHGREYREAGCGPITGFYDWLRKTEGQVIGVRYNPLKETNFPTDSIAALSYDIVRDKPPSIEIYFGADRSFDPMLSTDQDFGDNFLYVSRDGELVIAFGTHWLDRAEIASLRQTVADWVPLTQEPRGPMTPSCTC